MSERRKDDKNRWRSRSVTFRASPEEAIELDKRWRLCGSSCKREYLIESALKQKIVALGSPLMLIQFRKELREILAELERIDNSSDIDEELFTPIRTMLEILEAFRDNSK